MNTNINMKTMKIILILILASMISSDESCAAIRLKGKLSSPNDSPSYNDTNDTNLPENDRRILPKRGDVAVIVDGDDRQHVAIAEAMVIEELINRGYRVVDEAKMKRIKMAAARAMLPTLSDGF